MTGKRGSGKGPRPQTWKTGTDPVLHHQYCVWLQKRNQATWRGEGWLLSFEDFVTIWGQDWSRQGRWRDCLQMMRDDYDRPWSRDNVIIVDRAEFHRRQGLRKQVLQARKQHAKV